VSIVTPCGSETNDANCGYCLDTYECGLLREALCQGCMRTCCPAEFKRKMQEKGGCRGREMNI
jgi:hypothetical protein